VLLAEEREIPTASMDAKEGEKRFFKTRVATPPP
jgi:hypothetical protein